MLKSVVLATLALAVAGSSIVYAQQRSDREGGGRGSPFERQFKPSVDDIEAFTDARIAALRAGLTLTPDQEKNWTPFEQALRDLANLHLQGMQEREAGKGQERPANPFDRLQRRADALSQFGAALKRVADAGTPLFQSLNDAQKQRFRFLAHILRPRWMADGGFWNPEFGSPREGRHGMMGRDSDGSGPDGKPSLETDEDSERL
jgi:zinc resistance-associated protein